MKLDVIGFYHSHPDHPAAPSAYDKDHALPFYSYVIVSVQQGKAQDFTSWELTADRTAFLQEHYFC
jgi:proteasome lid subunit RPN8/RPN11